MCDTFVALPGATADGSILFGKNSDREPNEAQSLEYHPPCDHPKGELLQCTYLQVPQVRQTYGVLISRPFWMWGAEIGANEKGVVIGNEAVFTRMPLAKGRRLTGMDLLRLALERSADARVALQRIIDLLAEHGQGGPCGYQDKKLSYHNSYLIADPREAWVLETAGPLWAALKISDLYSISNGLTIGENFDRSHPDLIDTARRRGWLKKGETFDFARCYSDWLYTTFSACKRRRERSTRLPTTKAGKFTVKDAFSVLRDHGPLQPYRPDRHLLMNRVCAHSANGLLRNAAQSTASLIAALKPDSQTLWATGTSAPCTGVFKPIWLEDRVLPDIGPLPGPVADDRSLWWRHEQLHRRLLMDFPNRLDLIRDRRDALETGFLAEAQDSIPDKRFSLTKSAFARSLEAEKLWLEEIDGTPPRGKPLFQYRRYWAVQNRNAGIKIRKI